MVQLRSFLPLWLPCAGWAFLAACAATQDSSHDPISRVNQLVRHGHYAQAVEEAVRLRKEDPVRVEYELLHQATSVAHLLARGRAATLQDQDYLALSLFNDAASIDPDEIIVTHWIDKTKLKLATSLTNEAVEHASNDSYQEAWRSFTKALEYVPDFTPAHEGLAAMDTKMAYRQDLAAEYYDQGVANLVAKEFAIAENRFGYVRKYRDEDSRLVRRIRQVDHARSVEHQEAALLLEGAKLFYAARSEYGQALRQDSSNEAAREGLDRSTLEAEVSNLMGKGESALMRGEFEKARILFGEAAALTSVQKEEIDESIAGVESAQVDFRYQAAQRLELDLRYPEALKAYGELLVQAPGHSDVEERMTDLQGRVDRTKSMYRSLSSQADKAAALRTLLEIDDLWPDYRDVPERIDTLKNKGIRPAPKTP